MKLIANDLAMDIDHLAARDFVQGGCKSADAVTYARVGSNYPGELKLMNFSWAANNRGKEAAVQMAKQSLL